MSSRYRIVADVRAVVTAHMVIDAPDEASALREARRRLREDLEYRIRDFDGNSVDIFDEDIETHVTEAVDE